ncbi:MAG: DUF4869 domain-containing protein [Clostridia bacterium]|nr:DUF4869 domain-containing protein [Clostridia bacterium]
MLSVFFGSLPNEIYNPPLYFLNQYEDEWLTTDLTKEMVRSVDSSEVLGPKLIDSPVLGAISPRELSGGVKTLILMAYDDSGKIFNGTACGDNCARWILEIAKNKDLTITLHNIMKFDQEPFEIRILNSNRVVTSFREYVGEALDWVP